MPTYRPAKCLFPQSLQILELETGAEVRARREVLQMALHLARRHATGAEREHPVVPRVRPFGRPEVRLHRRTGSRPGTRCGAKLSARPDGFVAPGAPRHHGGRTASARSRPSP